MFFSGVCVGKPLKKMLEAIYWSHPEGHEKLGGGFKDSSPLQFPQQ